MRPTPVFGLDQGRQMSMIACHRRGDRGLNAPVPHGFLPRSSARDDDCPVGGRIVVLVILQRQRDCHLQDPTPASLSLGK